MAAARKDYNMKPNGHDRTARRANGHGTISPSGAAHNLDVAQGRGRAASDDTREFPNAAAASSAVAGTERDECAEVALPLEGDAEEKGNRARGGRRVVKKGEEERVSVDIPPGTAPLAPDGPTFVDDMHARVDLYLACARLVKSRDEKIAQRMVERLLEMSYGKSPAPQSDEPPQIIFDVPRPARE